MQNDLFFIIVKYRTVCTLLDRSSDWIFDYSMIGRKKNQLIFYKNLFEKKRISLLSEKKNSNLLSFVFRWDPSLSMATNFSKNPWKLDPMLYSIAEIVDLSKFWSTLYILFFLQSLLVLSYLTLGS